MPPLVSVLIPAYNAAPWLGATIESVLAQTWPAVEVIVVDDGSSDATLEVARKFESRSVKVLAQPNMGAPAARNNALQHAQGEYVQWLDADDQLDTEKIAAQMRVALQIGNPHLLLACPFGIFYNRPANAVFTPTSLWENLEPVDYFLRRFNDNAWFQTAAWLVSRQLTEAAGPWSDAGSPDDDGEYFCRLVTRSAGVKFVTAARTFYRVGNSGSLHNARSARAMQALFRSKTKCVGYLLALEDSERTRAACVALLQEWMPYFYPEHPDLVREIHALARSLGGELREPSLTWKYRPVKWLFGYGRAVQASRTLPRIRMHVASHWESYVGRLAGIRR